MEKVLQFLRELSANNNREWFDANKPRYVECRQKVLFLTDVLINEIRKFDHSVPLLDAKDCMFRIFRDVRFSNDKRPYKTNFGSFIAKGGRKSECPGYYFHIEPGNSFVGGGLYMPAAAPLKAVREHIASAGYEFSDIINDPDFKAALPEMFDDRLKTAPKGFPKDHEFIELLRYKSFAFSAPVSDETLTRGDFIDKATEIFRQQHKANQFLIEALRDYC
ncbi:MAG: DUF2461 domain-containing protein [Prolixibacteraceae bacterium]